MSREHLLPSEQKRSFIVKSDDFEITSYGKRPEERTVPELLRLGVINVDKHPNPTSQEIVAYIKKIFGLTKAGHSGTLDPAVSGVLPVALEDATKITKALLTAGKEYVCIMHLHSEAKASAIKKVMQEFVGEIYVGCEKGTYIRKLCHDIGLVLGTGAHMKELRRTKSGPFKEDETLSSLTRIYDAYATYTESGDETELRKVVLPMERGLIHLPKIIIRDNAIGAICHGASLAIPGVLKLHDSIVKGDLVLLESLKGEAVALAIAELNAAEIVAASHGLAARTTRVLMDRAVYPKVWKESTKR